MNRKNMKPLSKMAKGVNYITYSNNHCQIFLVGKQARQLFEERTSRSEQVLALIHTGGLCGPMETTSIGGSSRYFLFFVDDYSRKTFVYFLMHKSEVLNVFKKLW